MSVGCDSCSRCEISSQGPNSPLKWYGMMFSQNGPQKPRRTSRYLPSSRIWELKVHVEAHYAPSSAGTFTLKSLFQRAPKGFRSRRVSHGTKRGKRSREKRYNTWHFPVCAITRHSHLMYHCELLQVGSTLRMTCHRYISVAVSEEICCFVCVAALGLSILRSRIRIKGLMQ